jgi:hypothetical protein
VRFQENATIIFFVLICTKKQGVKAFQAPSKKRGTSCETLSFKNANIGGLFQPKTP